MARTFSPPAAGEPFIVARNLSMKTPLGTAYANVSLDVPMGQLCSVVAGNGEGKTELLLTLAGRMKPTSGRLEVAGLALPRKRARVRRMSGMGFFEHVNDVQPVLSVRSVVAAELNLYSKRSWPKYVRAFLDEWGLAAVAKKKIEELDRLTYVRLGIGLGLVGSPCLLVVDDIESELTRHQSLKLMDELRELAHGRGMTVLVACTDYDLGAYADQAVPISDSARAQARAVLLRASDEAGADRTAVLPAAGPDALAPVQDEPCESVAPAPAEATDGASSGAPSEAEGKVEDEGEEVSVRA